MKNTKRFLALALSAIMTIGSATMVFAATPNSGKTLEGDGDLEGWVNVNVITLDCPTEASNLAFHIDPQGLASKTNGAKHGNANIEENATVLFKTSDGSEAKTTPASVTSNNEDLKVALASGFDPAEDTVFKYEGDTNPAWNPSIQDKVEIMEGTAAVGNTITVKKATTTEATPASYAKTSLPIVIKNYSAIGVDLTVKVKITDATGITLTDNNTFAPDDTDAKLYMALEGKASAEAEDKKLTAALSTKDLTISNKELGGAANAYEYGYDSTDGYTFTLKKDLSKAAFQDYTFTITGAANPNGDWSKLTEAAPKLSVVYSAVKHGTGSTDTSDSGSSTGGSGSTDPVVEDKAPSIDTKAYTYDKSEDLSITVDLGSGDKVASTITSVTWSNAEDGEYKAFTKDTQWSINGTTLKILAGRFGSANAGDKKYVKVTFNDNEPTVVLLTLTIK